MKKFDIFNQFRDAVIIVNNKREVVYQNYTFKRWFSDFFSLKKFSHNYNFDICPLSSENLENYSPIYHALNCDENFFACVSYRDNHEKISYYDLSVIKKGNYTIFFFSDVSAQTELLKSEKQIEKLQNDYKNLEEENEDLQKIKQKAQSQAIRIALINKVSNIVRESVDLSKILNSALTELALMFGAFKAYYAEAKNKNFKVTEIYGGKKFSDNISISFDDDTLQTITGNKISVVHCLKEYIDAEPFKHRLCASSFLFFTSKSL